MAGTSPLADAFMEGWQEYRRCLVETIRPLTAEQLQLRATTDLRPAWEIAAHVVGARASWFFYHMHEGNEEFAQLSTWGRNNDTPKTTVELVAGLETTWQFLRDTLAHWTDTTLAAPLIIEGFEQYPVSRAWVLWHLLEHDLHHGGELAYLLGIHNIPVLLPPPPPKT